MWVTGRLWRVLAVHAAGLCCPDGVLELLVDDTLAHKSGRKVAGAGVFRDAVRSTKNRVVYAWGLNVVVVCLRVTPPWGGTPIALPINLRIHTKGNKTTLELTEEMIREIADWFPDRSLHLTGDGAYASLLGARLPRTQVTSRIRRDAAIYQPAPPRTGKRGRPATKGKKLPKPFQLAATLPAEDWQAVTVDERGRAVERPVHTRDVLWYQVNREELVRLTIVRDPTGTCPDDFFVSTDRTATGADTATRYAGRWPIEKLQGRQAARRGRAPADLEGRRPARA